MPLLRHRDRFEPLGPEALAEWAEIPTAIASDCMNRARTLGAAIKPLAPGTRLVGQARTVACMVGDNSALHAVLRLVRPGEVLVTATGGHPDTALWGGLLTRAALTREVAGVVLDGAVRDVAEIRALGFACFAAAAVPAGPHKGFGGTIDGVIACAGCAVSPGDIVLGDDDGVAVVPLGQAQVVLAACREKLAQETAALERLERGTLLADQMGIPEPGLAD